MATKKKAKEREPIEDNHQQVRFSVAPGTKVQINVEVGETDATGKVPLTISVEPSGREQAVVEKTHPPEPALVQATSVSAPRSWDRFEALRGRLKTYDLAMWLFVLAIAVYLVTRLIGLTQFPIYFFTDEAIQLQSIADLVRTGYKDSNGVWFPTYFRNGEYYNLSLSVYLQWLPYLIFGKSAVVTRATSIFVTLLAALSVGLILREAFKLKYWWVGTLFLSITPSWFLHSRTAFETAEFTAFYAATLCAYLFYRYKSPRYIFLTIFLGALSFYSYNPAQMIVPLTALGLLLSDLRYHWDNRRLWLIAVPLILLLILPYFRFSLNNPTAPFAHLHTLWSYWFEKIPVTEKIARYFSEFGIGLSPWYWYAPNDRDLARHLMKDYGHIMIATLPFALLGLAHVLRNLRQSACRLVLIALLVSPAAAALVQISITRALVFVIPAAILTSIGFEQVLHWVAHPKQQLAGLRAGAGPTATRVGAGGVILLVGIIVAFLSDKLVNLAAILALALILALQVSGILEQLAQSLPRARESSSGKTWSLTQTALALTAFLILTGTNIHMLNDAIRNGSLWYRDYGMGGMQYGAFQIFDIIAQYRRENPDTSIIFSPDWANGTDVVARFFLGDPLPIQMGSVRGHIAQKLPLDDKTLFVLTPQEYELVMTSDKLTDIEVERIVPYPDGSPGFYFLRLRYVDNIDEIFAAEKSLREALRESVLMIDGQEVKLRFSYLDTDLQAESMASVFDNDPFTVAKTLESNPFVIEMTFPTPRTLNGFSIIIGSAQVRITLKCYEEPGAEPVLHTFEGQGTRNEPELSFDLPSATEVRVLQMEILDLLAAPESKIHIWELRLR